MTTINNNISYFKKSLDSSITDEEEFKQQFINFVSFLQDYQFECQLFVAWTCVTHPQQPLDFKTVYKCMSAYLIVDTYS